MSTDPYKESAQAQSPQPQNPPAYIYTYANTEDEASLCAMELRCLFGQRVTDDIFASTTCVEVSRSPFLKERVDVIYTGNTLEEIYTQTEQIDVGDSTFKVICVKISDLPPGARIDYDGRRAIEREIGLRIHGEADVKRPDIVYGLAALGGRWYFGIYHKNDATWLRQMQKPRSYSIALSTRVARAAVNMAVPDPLGVKAIDPCCGIGTVMVEALSMGIDMVGRDINPLIVAGARANIAHFGFTAEVTLGDIADIEEHYDAAIVDMPYNLYSSITPEEQFAILDHTRRIADRVLIVAIEAVDEMIHRAGFEIVDRCVAKKGSFSRHLMLCI
ncbi:TRM11 family SAM-dependent methyltransferase [Paenibacillus tengchongensis]|uniref:TRM11 family SAM-dependent methyltransferase n=1 Tax=Paenibacillus tengchongensis TaxID=2608684 RepID=UPI001FEA7A95|nr:RNA methyltransferase [Paenibacillus tengchongensis]